MRDSDTIDVGIDLGTTNSAVAVAGPDGVVVVKNNDGGDTTPSAVWLPRPDLLQVGRKARERVESDPDNAAAEFKLEMGLADARRSFAKARRELTPPELSAEILKSLRADAAFHLGAAPQFAVITVPAAFTLNQNKATTEAAALAGFDPACPLVQEPTAAAFAYGFQEANDRGYWLVFDFGGGTFDAAVVSKRDGELRVLNHAGDPYLGGKLIDWAIVERVLAPAASRELGLPEMRRDNPAWRRNFSILKGAAEEAKIQLSRRSEVPMTLDLHTGAGDTETFEYTLRRDELDAIAEPFYVRAMNLCRSALQEASLGVGDLDRLLLVGGTTLAPGLRERLADPRTGIGIELDASLDPTTVVARGAAIFASTIRRPAAASAPPVPAGEFAIALAYEPSVTTATPTVGGRLSGPATVDWTQYSVALTNPDGQPPFRSAQIRLNANGAFATDVDVDPHRTSRFTVELTDGTGTRCKVTPDTLSITHRDVEFGGVRLAHSLGIQLADQAFAPMLRKGATLPTRVREVFRTASALQRSDPDAVVRIPVVQGEHSQAERNRAVGMLEIRPRDVRIDLPAGSEVEVTFEVDASSLVTVVADVPLVQEQFEAEIDLDQVRTADPETLRGQLAEIEQRLAALRGAAAASAEARRRLESIDHESAVLTARDQVSAAAVDVGAAAAAEERLRNLQAEMDAVEDAVRLPAQTRELREMLDEAAELVQLQGTEADRRELTGLRRRAQEAIDADDVAGVRDQGERVRSFLFELERRSPDWPVKLYFALLEAVPPSGAADALFQEGRNAVAAQDVQALSAVNQRLIRLLPREEQAKIIGLRKA